MPGSVLKRQWYRKTKEIFSLPHMSRAKKVLAYKIFLRPMLVYQWFTVQPSQLKVLEIKALRQIFGNLCEHRLYEKYTDIDVVSYMKLQGIKWQKVTGSPIRNVRRMLYAVSKLSDDPTYYFTNTRLFCSQSDEETDLPGNEKHCNEITKDRRQLRRSLRLAVKDNK
ncbi:unnamed protein product [Diatraea saccharalis]|uniref:Uncharacterized protein n=1 Tax=Diatraea saccharalis TaxID=40085 RepID=A0A9N9R1P6_9NEOP|nr:unnamed protein product [Diatraea saccharalis]